MKKNQPPAKKVKPIGTATRDSLGNSPAKVKPIGTAKKDSFGDSPVKPKTLSDAQKKSPNMKNW